MPKKINPEIRARAETSMYSAIACRAFSWVGKVVRWTSSFRAAKKDSAMALSQHIPVLPIEPASLCFPRCAANWRLVY